MQQYFLIVFVVSKTGIALENESVLYITKSPQPSAYTIYFPSGENFMEFKLKFF